MVRTDKIIERKPDKENIMQAMTVFLCESERKRRRESVHIFTSLCGQILLCSADSLRMFKLVLITLKGILAVKAPRVSSGGAYNLLVLV